MIVLAERCKRKPGKKEEDWEERRDIMPVKLFNNSSFRYTRIWSILTVAVNIKVDEKRNHKKYHGGSIIGSRGTHRFQKSSKQHAQRLSHDVSLCEKQKDRLKNLVTGKDVFAIFPTGFGQRLIFRLLPRIINRRDPGTVLTIVIVAPLLATMKDKLEWFNALGVVTTAIGVDEGLDESAAKNGRCEIVYGSPRKAANIG